MSLEKSTIKNLRELGDGVWIGGQPTAEQLEEAARQGLKSIVNLCGSAECNWDEQAVAEGVGLQYSNIPVRGAGDLTHAVSRRLQDVLEVCPRPVLVHCGTGSRVGALFAVKARYVDGCDAGEALQQGRRAGLLPGLEAAVRQALDAG